ncbi:hypothetical protein [Peptoniphilus raoultii]|uniref:hypothetical protein n=1 Tax=Peptoniphilus raoultii TaxID=1776387 RepID=UPI0009F67C46|nr:hypothetical protein [Peptoniphilus raoultii]
MAFLENFDSNISQIRENLSQISLQIRDRSKDFKKIAKIRYELLMEKRNLSNLYKELGEYYYRLLKDEAVSFNVESQKTKIDISLSRIASLENSLADVGNDREENNFYYRG